MTPRSPAPSSMSTWGVLGSMAAIAWIGGGALPMAFGWSLPLAVMIIAAFIVRGRLGAAVPLGGWTLAVRARGPVLRAALVLATGFPAVVFACVLAGALGQLLVAFPGATLALAIVGLAGVVVERIGRVAAWSMPFVVVGLAVIGARFEADGPAARGVTYSGPILGIHPFQSTAVIIDGFGPFDLPINDFVEPNGGRGYDALAYADALERSLHRIAEVHFADGPARAREAFAGATVELVMTPRIRERLDRDPAADAAAGETAVQTQPRVKVSSGTTGQRSRVEFVCPGRRDDPRGARPDTVMSRSCPTKYASEASAGLGFTGRWPGYVEMRGNERVGLSRLLGVTRSAGPTGAEWIARERWIYAAIVLLIVLALVLVRGGAPATATLHVAGPLALPLLVLVLCAAWMHSSFAVLAARTLAPPWLSITDGALWVGALVWPGAAAMLAWSTPEIARRDVGRRLLPPLAVMASLWFAATDLGAGAWLSPPWWNTHGPIEAAVVALADAVATLDVLPIGELETVVAVAVGAPMIVACVALLRAVVVAVGAAAPSSRPLPVRAVAVLVVLLAIALGVSRKTAGGVALIPAATGVALVLGSALRRIAARGVWPRTHAPRFASLVHLVWIAIGLGLVAQSLPARGGDPLRWVYFAIAVVAAVLPLAACFADPEPASGSTGSSGSGDAPR